MADRDGVSAPPDPGPATGSAQPPQAPPSARVTAALAVLAGAAFVVSWAQVPEGGALVRKVFLERLAATRGWHEPWRILAAPWFHGDPLHLLGNLLGLALLGTLLERARGGAAVALAVAGGALLGGVCNTALGAHSLGLSGGIYALAGVLVRLHPGPGSALAGAAWLGFGFWGGLLTPAVDWVAHALGALWGYAAAPALERPRPGAALGLVLLWLLGPLWALGHAGQATAATVARRPALEAVERAGELVEATVPWHRERRLALEALLGAARYETPLDEPSLELHRLLRAPEPVGQAAARFTAGLDGLESQPGASAYLPALQGLLPAPPPPYFRTPGPYEVHESHRHDWKALMDHLSGSEEAVGRAAAALEAWSRGLE